MEEVSVGGPSENDDFEGNVDISAKHELLTHIQKKPSTFCLSYSHEVSIGDVKDDEIVDHNMGGGM